MMWVVIRSKDTGKYVVWPGCARSYTTNLLDARRFGSVEQAEKEACGNERVEVIK